MMQTAFAIAAHPDDIEFMMGGTLLRLAEQGWRLHYMNVANGSCGSMVHGKQDTIQMRLLESRAAADALGATFHPPLVDDLMVYYTPELVAKLAAIIRQVQPTILLLPSPQDYMEDHMNVSRLGVTAAFTRNMPNFKTQPEVEHVDTEMAIYHALPYGLRDDVRQLIRPDFYIDIESVIDRKAEILAMHQSQKQWLDDSQGLDSYLITMKEMSAEVGEMSGKFVFAEGWRRHNHLGFGPETFDPLREALNEFIS